MVEPIISLRIPNPFVEGRNRVYVITSSPVTMIDTGVATERAFEALVAGLGEHGLSLDDIERVLLTHKHIDHIGNAWRVQRQSGAEILIHNSETHAVTDVDPRGERFTALVRERLNEWNVPGDAFPDTSARRKIQWEIEPAEATGIQDGERIPMGDGEWEVIHTPGHTMGSVCLCDGRHLFSGDHVLPDISPNVGGGDMRQRGLLRHYLQSLDRIVAEADGSVRVLPGHGEPFDRLHERCRELIAHHHERLETTVEILTKESPQSVYEIARQLFGEMQDFHVVLGCAEAAAHLDYLVDEGQVVWEDGRYRLA